MNTMIPSAPVGRIRILLEREFWEHKGGFFWAPVVTAGLVLLISVMAAVWASVKRRGDTWGIKQGDPAEVQEALGAAGDMAMLSGVGITSLVLGFVVFFYALGSLYDDRKDRSVLFWKSMPVSDTATVASKAVWAALLGPLAAVLIGLALGLGLWLLGLATTSVNGISGASGILTHSHPFQVMATILALLPVYALWALPTIGWLMLCSAAAPSKPFLWALIIPVMGCAIITMVSSMLNLGFEVKSLWYVVAIRPLLSVFPMTFLASVNERVDQVQIDGPGDIHRLFDAVQSTQLLASVDLWVGAAIGLVMIVAATRLRRWRDEG
ncbi:MAG: ABC transporter, permease protein [uncultured Lysobacter sp.]|uniref:ABC transporter, permease protein n=1 Tax=uncultured Lysobacter sp. TaxID=271060 RepID=A0A6J4KFN0_9GAMM|nr:MAG: ABC transporter, permease protein [uncultured Lysobacter sp.]